MGQYMSSDTPPAAAVPTTATPAATPTHGAATVQGATAVAPKPQSGSAVVYANPEEATLRILKLCQEAETRMLRLRERFNAAHSPFVVQTQRDLKEDALREAAEKAEAAAAAGASPESGTTPPAAEAAAAGSADQDGATENTEAKAEEATKEPPLHPVQAAAAALDTLSENLTSHMLFFRAPTSVHSSTSMQPCCCAVAHPVPARVSYACGGYVALLRPAEEVWFEQHSYCDLCQVMHKSPCENAYTAAMTCHSLYKCGEFPQEHCNRAIYNFTACGFKNSAYFQSQMAKSEEEQS